VDALSIQRQVAERRNTIAVGPSLEQAKDDPSHLLF
jgi:hypothetical protein